MSFKKIIYILRGLIGFSNAVWGRCDSKVYQVVRQFFGKPHAIASEKRVLIFFLVLR
jgi:hypothetical protein